MNIRDEDRAAYHLNRQRAVRVPRAEEQSGDMFPDLQPQPRRLVEPAGLFTQPRQQRRLVVVDGWPDYRRDSAS